MELEMQEMWQSLTRSLEQMAAAANALEGSAARLEQCGHAQSGEVQKITAAIEGNLEGTRREMELARRLAEAEQALAGLQAAGTREETKAAAARKTLPTATVQLLAKQGIDAGDGVDLPSLDAALVGMSVEQRIAVKSQLLRTGALIR